MYFWVYRGVYRELTTPAPVILRQNPISKPTPPTPCVPCEWVVSVFYVVFGIFGGRGWSVRGFELVQGEGFQRGCRGSVMGQRESERRVIDDDERGI